MARAKAPRSCRSRIEFMNKQDGVVEWNVRGTDYHIQYHPDSDLKPYVLVGARADGKSAPKDGLRFSTKTGAFMAVFS